jgi:hypothetical protein
MVGNKSIASNGASAPSRSTEEQKLIAVSVVARKRAASAEKAKIREKGKQEEIERTDSAKKSRMAKTLARNLSANNVLPACSRVEGFMF